MFGCIDEPPKMLICISFWSLPDLRFPSGLNDFWLASGSIRSILRTPHSVFSHGGHRCGLSHNMSKTTRLGHSPAGFSRDRHHPLPLPSQFRLAKPSAKPLKIKPRGLALSRPPGNVPVCRGMSQSAGECHRSHSQRPLPRPASERMEAN